MRLKFSQFAEALRSSYWFIPASMTLLAVLLGALMVYLDAGPGAGLLDGIGWYQSAKPDGAHQVLSTIAGSMITVAGVVFSITIVALAYAAGQYGPRILTNFMSDRGNQITLGTFIGTFAYCLVVLRTIRGGDSEFVPQLAVMTGIALALCSIGVLIYFIHHVPQSIHVNIVIARIGRQLIASVGDRYPECIGRAPSGGIDELPTTAEVPTNGCDVCTVEAEETGYIQAIDDEEIMRAARSSGGVVRLTHRPGAFVHTGRALLTVSSDRALPDGVAEALRSSHLVGDKRTPAGDLTFLIDELVEIGARALSSGVNDPYTAMSCLDWMGAGATEIARRQMPSPLRCDEDGQLRVIAVPETFENYVERSFGRMRQYVGRDVNAAVHTLRVLDELAQGCARGDQVDTVQREASRLMNVAEHSLDGASLAEVHRCYGELNPPSRSTG